MIKPIQKESNSIRKGFLNIYNWLKIPYTHEIDGSIKQFTIKPINNGQFFYLYIVYEENKKEEVKINKNRYLSIDLGINNLMATFDSTGRSIIINGKPLKAYNSWFNIKKSSIQSELEIKNKKKWSKRLQNLNEDRKNFINNYFNQSVNKIIKHCIVNDIGTVIVGYNKKWKQDTKELGKKFNRKFQQIPHFILKEKLSNKCSDYGIDLVFHEESYTSKCDALAIEKLKKQDVYLGKRIKRGLFQSSVGKLINADINGAMNIMRKVVSDSLFKGIIDNRLIVQPLMINIL